MNELKLINSGEYLSKKLRYEQEVSPTEIQESMQRLRQPIAEIQYENEGDVEVEGKEYKLKFNYSLIDSQDEEDVLAYIDVKKDYIPEEERERFLDVKSWRRLNSLVIIPINSGKEIDIFEAIPKNYKVFFYPLNNFINGSCILEQNNIYLIGGLTSLEAITALLHETGHAWDFSNLEKLGVEKITDDSIHSDNAEKLRRERTANAFALKVMKPFLSPEEKKDVINLLKNLALNTYEDDIKRQLTSKVSMDYFARDYEYDEEAEEHERFMWEEWEKFRETDEYKKWKEMEEFKGLDEYKGYGAWCEWIEKQWEEEASKENLEA